ncbi:MAG: bifunctional YncE family protein/alkaline phosphatase family protein [Acidobacteria bacterium]|nr:bifunctional YncE family protein/alkaline phosphatase family protein [Acidobacteriota bacterium]
MRTLGIAGAALAGTLLVAWQSPLFPVLKSTVLSGRQAGGFYLVPTHQLLRPWGEQTLLAGRPVDMAFDAEGRILAVLNWDGVDVLDAVSGAALAHVKSKGTSYAGIAFRPGSRELWASETTRQAGSILVTTVSPSGRPGEAERIALKEHPVPTGMAFSSDGARAWVALSRDNAVALLDARERKVIRQIPVGIAPFGVVIAEKQGRVFVSNRGGRRPVSGDAVAPSSGTEVATDAATGASKTGTVSVVDLKTFETREIAVGLAPSMMAASPGGALVAVVNSHSDSVSLIDAKSLNVTTVAIPAWPEKTLGSQPSAVAFAPSGDRLYVACGGTNAVVVLGRAAGRWTVQGAVPTGWFPSAIALDASGALRVLNIKGLGNTTRAKGGFNSRSFEGSLLKIAPPTAPQLAAGLREVRAANEPRFDPAGGVETLSSLGVKHVVLIIKENRTYDQVFGDIAKGNGDPKLVMYGRDVTPNHHALAEQYVLLDNFYTGGAISFDGHQWLMQSFVSDYVERAFSASPRGYAWNMADALTVSPAGFFWQSATRPLDIRIYGEFCLPARWNPQTRSVVDMNEDDDLPWRQYWALYQTGQWPSEVGCQPGVPALRPQMSLRYPYSSMAITDQIRADEFLRELAEREKSGAMPHISILTLNQDHTEGKRPDYPTPRAMVADNDLALGRIVEGLSKSRFWPNTLVLVVEDDAQDGVDHVDGRRTVALAVGPYVRRGVVDSNYYTHTSMIRTIQDIFEIPARTRYLKSARAMTSVFQPDAAPAPYQALAPKVALDEMNPPVKALSGRALWAARQSMAMNFKEIDDVPRDVLNRILWWDAKGWDTPYPVKSK